MTQILFDILAPILLMVFFGALLRWKFKLDMASLTKLNIYLFVPAFIFDRISTSRLDWSQMGGIVGMTALHVGILGVLVWGIGRAVGASRKSLAAIALSIMFYNSGNFGLPLAELAFRERGAEVQAFVLMTQNLLTFTVGLSLAAVAHQGNVGTGLLRLLRMPILPALLLGLLARWWTRQDPANELPSAISETARYLAGGLVPIALVTLGAQLAINPRWPRWKPVGIVMFARLIYGPLQMLMLLWLFHLAATTWGGGWSEMTLWPWPAQLLILTAGVPTAVNTLLLTLEMGGDADLSADCVFWTTVCSALTLTGWLLVLRAMF